MSSPEDPKITYYSTVLAIALKNGDGYRFNSLYDTYTKDLNPEEVQQLKELVRNYEKLPVQTLQGVVKWRSGMNKQDTVDVDNKTSPPESSMSNDHPSDDATITLSIAGKAKSTPPQASSNKSSSSWANKPYSTFDNVPFMDDDSDTGLASENRYIPSYGGGTGDFVACNKGGVTATNSGGLEERKRDSWKRFSEQDRENYLRNRGDPVAISIGDGISYDNHQTIVCDGSNDWESILAGNGFSQSKNSSGDESGDSRSGASIRSKENKKLHKKKRKQSRSLNGEAELDNEETDSKDEKLGAGISAAAQRNRRRKKWNETHNKTAAEQEEENMAEQCIASAPVLTSSVGTTASERPKKKRSVKAFKEEKAREQNFSSQLTTLQYFKEMPISVNIKQENTLKKKKQEEEKRKEEIKEFLSEERMIEIIKSIEDVSGDKKKPKEIKAVAPPPKQKGKKNKKNKKTADQEKKNQLNENKSGGSSVVGETEKNNMDGEMIVGGKVELSISDNDDGDKDFVIQRRSRKTNASKNNNPASGRTSPSALQGKRDKRRYSDPSPKTDEIQQTKSPTGSNHQSSSTSSHRGNAVAVATTTTSNHCASSAVENMRAKAADLSNENNWPKLEAAFMPSTSNHDGISAVQTGSNHQSVASYASKLKANLDSIGCSPASSGEDGNSSTSSGGGLSNVNQYSNCTTSPNEFEPSSSFSNHSSNQSDLVSFAENHLKCSAAASKKDLESSSSISVVTSFSVSASSNNREQEISWAGSSSSNVGVLDQPTDHRSSDLIAAAGAKSAGGKTTNKKSCDVPAATSAKANGDRSVKKTEKITASGQTATTEITFTTRVENSAVANKKSAVETKTATADKKRESTNKNEVTKAASPLKKGNENVVKKAPPKQQVATLPRKANNQSKYSTDEKKKASAAPPVAFHDTDADVRTILQNNDWKFSFFYNDPSMPDPIDISSCLNSKKEPAGKQQSTASSKSPQSASSAADPAVDEKSVVPKDGEQEDTTPSSSAVTEKTATSASLESSSVLAAAIVLTEPKRRQRLLNGTTVTSAWNDPGQFNVLAAQKFFLKRFKELSKTAVCYSRNHSD